MALSNILSSVASDASKYFIKDNKGVNNVVLASAAVASPDILTMIAQLSAGVDLQSALATGGVSMYIAIGVIVMRFALYLATKTAETK